MGAVGLSPRQANSQFKPFKSFKRFKTFAR
jgi:hypothetical protein